MAHSNPCEEDLTTLLTKASTIAMVGASSNLDQASYGIRS
jgi:predicted CoA-binding protein